MMKVKVVEGYVSFARKVYGPGTVLEMGTEDAAYLIAQGVAEEADAAAPVVAQQTAEAAASAVGDDEMTLPDVDPAAAVKTGSKK